MKKAGVKPPAITRDFSFEQCSGRVKHHPRKPGRTPSIPLLASPIRWTVADPVPVPQKSYFTGTVTPVFFRGCGRITKKYPSTQIPITSEIFKNKS
jgi:hypothetical protein